MAGANNIAIDRHNVMRTSLKLALSGTVRRRSRHRVLQVAGEACVGKAAHSSAEWSTKGESGCSLRTQPKSVSCSVSGLVMRMLSGFTSRCTMPNVVWQCCSASASCCMSPICRESGIRRKPFVVGSSVSPLHISMHISHALRTLRHVTELEVQSCLCGLVLALIHIQVN